MLTEAILLSMLAFDAPGHPRRPPPRKPAHGSAEHAPALVERLNRMSPAERSRMLDKLPPDRRERVERRLERYSSLAADDRERLQEEYETFQQLSPEDQNRVRDLFRQYNDLASGRRLSVRRELQRLRGMNAEERSSRVQSDSFRERFNESEQKLLDELSSLLGK